MERKNAQNYLSKLMKDFKYQSDREHRNYMNRGTKRNDDAQKDAFKKMSKIEKEIKRKFPKIDFRLIEDGNTSAPQLMAKFYPKEKASVKEKIEARLESAAVQVPEWFKKLSKEKQKEYLEKHPNSKLAKSLVGKPSDKKLDKPMSKSKKLAHDALKAAFPFGGNASKSVESVIRKLEKQGLVEVVSHEPLDGSLNYVLTAKGKEIVRKPNTASIKDENFYNDMLSDVHKELKKIFGATKVKEGNFLAFKDEGLKTYVVTTSFNVKDSNKVMKLISKHGIREVEFNAGSKGEMHVVVHFDLAD